MLKPFKYTFIDTDGTEKTATCIFDEVPINEVFVFLYATYRARLLSAKNPRTLEIYTREQFAEENQI